MARWCALACLAALVALSAAADKSRLPDLPAAQQAEVDDMVNNLLQWIQGLYQQKNTRKARQYFGGRPEKPRPFEPASYLPPYPPAGQRPTPSYNEGPVPGKPSQPPKPVQPSYQPAQPSQPPYQPASNPPTFQPPTLPPYQPSQETQTPYQPSETFPTNQPNEPTYQPTQPPYQPSQPEQPSYQPGYPPSQPAQPEFQPNQPAQPGYQPNQPGYQPTGQPNYETIATNAPYQPSQPSVPVDTTQPPYENPQTEQTKQPQKQEIDETTGTGSGASTIESSSGTSTVSTGNTDEDEDRHPPHIHAITVDCGKEMMTINIEFNKPYNGIIYSQDHFNEPECVYVRENSNQVKFSFTVSLNSCGTRFFSDFENEGQAYLENVLVLQNEAGIQEVWDHIRRVRCLWEGNLTKQLVSSLSVGMLNQITSNFSGDTAMARLDIQTGAGPFAPEANGLIKIGERMTLVVSVTGDPGFDILVRECVARDADSTHEVMLTDHNGCVLKPKLFGAFQKTRDTGNTGASIIAYAFFNAFKFPDEMDLIIQCDVELCKTDCDVCTNPGSIEPRKRRRRDVIHIGNRTVDPVTTIGKGLRVVFAEDLPVETGFCISQTLAIWCSMMVLFSALISSAIASYCWKKSQSGKHA